MSNGEIEKFMSALAFSFDNEKKVKYSDEISKALEVYSDSFPTPYQFKIFIRRTLKEDWDHNNYNLAETIFEELCIYHNISVNNRLDFNVLRSFYSHYDMIDRHLSLVISRFEGGALSSDKANNLISQVANNIINGTNDYTYSWASLSPETLPLYVGIVKEIYMLSIGHVDNYINHYQVLKEYYENNGDSDQ